MSTAARPRLKHSFIALILVLVVGALFIPLASSPAYAVENDGSKAQLQAQSLNVETNAISAAPSNNLSNYEVYSTYIRYTVGTDYYLVSNELCMAIRPAGGQWTYWRGMTYLQTMRRIVLPQAFRSAFPTLSSYLIGLVKDTSLAANITVAEAFMATQRLVGATYEPFALYCELALVYLLFSTVLTHLQTWGERRLAVY